jgi:ribosome-associated translation inhibitor RaiA
MVLTTVHAQHFTLTPAIKQFAIENLQEPLEQIWTKRGAQLDIELRDIRGGDKQGEDKQCRCIFYMPNGPKLVITEVTEDMRKSIHQARKRLMRRVRQYVLQKIEGPRHPMKYFVAKVSNQELPDRYLSASELRSRSEASE